MRRPAALALATALLFGPARMADAAAQPTQPTQPTTPPASPTSPSSPSPPSPGQTYEPKVGQAGRDAVWVPSSLAVVERMLDVAKVTAADFVVDLGSGDGRTVIAAAKRGASALGVEFNEDLVGLSERAAEKEGVGDKARFVQGDMYAADISKATVLALFLLPANLDKLVPNFLALPAGSRIVANTFAPTGWAPDERVEVEGGCESWCTVLLWIVPAKVDGVWRVGDSELRLSQSFQTVSGNLTAGGQTLPIESGRLRGDQLTFRANGADYAGRVSGSTIEGTVTRDGTSQPFTAAKE